MRRSFRRFPDFGVGNLHSSRRVTRGQIQVLSGAVLMETYNQFERVGAWVLSSGMKQVTRDLDITIAV